ncbi:MAG: hypothetical protein P8100_14790 [bacterium]
MATNLTAINEPAPVSKSLIVDIVGLALIYFIPTFSHLLNFPLYLVEPMRVMLIIAIAHTTKRNAYLIALTLPFFSFLVSAHPVFYKTVIITLELLINTWLFYLLAKHLKNYFMAVVLSIALSKIVYYSMKFSLLNLSLLDGSLISTPIYFQLIIMLLVSGYLYLVLSRREAYPPIFTDPTK